ncbi:MAG: molecular chaperone HscC [Oceanospirillaceae bacterium]|nr:molecular chaperone HscC [Oceanospirillaceae bacterium]MBT11591.1 molecular chaperone HscC [Oceanospirillaceae bacterium]
MIIGIDLGTTNSLVARWHNDGPQLLANALGDYLTPSVVGVDAHGHVLVGRAARDRLMTHPQDTVAVFKRLMGTQSEVVIGGQSFSPQELSSFVLRQLKEDAEAATGETVTEAIITVPAYFNDTQRQMTRLAGRLAGLNVSRLINEPTAAALAYGIHKTADSTFLVFDLGGGTFDVSVLEIFDDVIEVRASAGDNRLGGEDFTLLIAHKINAACAQQGIREEDLEGRFRPNIYAEAERVKQALSLQHEVHTGLDLENTHVEFHYRREQFEQDCQPLLQRLIAPVKQALADATIRPSELDRVLLVGGATRMPVISKQVAQMFGALPGRELDPDQVVVMGAATQAALKARHQSLEEKVLTDVCPYTLGIEVTTEGAWGQKIHGVFSPIIERNTMIPVSRKETYYTVHDDQKMIRINVYQGESRETRLNILLGDMEVDVPPAPAGREAVDVRFSYDINGLLEVEVLVRSSGITSRRLLTQQEGLLSEEQINESLQRLQALKLSPRDNAINDALIARANRLYEQHLGERREAIGQLLDFFVSLVESGDKQEIERLRPEVEARLAEYEF